MPEEYDRFEALARPFARGIFDLASALRDEALQLNHHQSARMREAMSVAVRKACDVLVPDARTPLISVAATERAAQMRVDLRLETWQTQPKFDPGRAIFHYEHMQPVAAIVARMRQSAQPEDVIQVLWRELSLAWITKEEDQRLSELGYKFKRTDPHAAYAAAGIVLQDGGVAQPAAESMRAPDLWNRHVDLAWAAVEDATVQLPPDPTETWRSAGCPIDASVPIFSDLVAWWEPLLHLTGTGLGWTRPDLGLDHWRRLGYPPLHDPILRLILRWWSPQRLDEFIAWSTTTHSFRDLTSDSQSNPTGAGNRALWDHPVARDASLERSLTSSGWANLGEDPLHLLDHYQMTRTPLCDDHHVSGLTGQAFLTTQTAHLLCYYEKSAAVAELAPEPQSSGSLPLSEDQMESLVDAVNALEAAYVADRPLSRLITPGTNADGAISMPWYDYDEVIWRALRAVSEVCGALQHPHAGNPSLIEDFEGVANSTAGDLLGCLERLGSLERVVTGAIEAALQSGVLPASAVRVRGMITDGMRSEA